MKSNIETLDAYTTYVVAAIRTAGPKKGQQEKIVSRTNEDGKFEALRGYKFLTVLEKLGQ